MVALCSTCAALGAQQPAFAREDDAAKIEAAYRTTPPWSALRFERVDRLPFVFFIQDQDRGSLRVLADQREFALRAIVKLFEQRFAEPLKLKRRERPLPFWILASRADYRRYGGSEFTLAHFDLVDLHTVTYVDNAIDTQDAFHTAMHESVHQIMYAYTDPAMPVQVNAMSAWLMEGMAEHLASRPKTALLKNVDPEFGWLDAGRIGTLAEYLGREFQWTRQSRIPWLHHPLVVMTFQTLPQYLLATGASTSRPEDYASQGEFFYRCSYAVTVFLDHGFRGHFRRKLLDLLRLEYDGRHGAVALHRVFSPEERAALPALFEAFVRDPAGVCAAALPAGADRAEVVPEDAPEPDAAPAPPASPPRVALAESLVDVLCFDLAPAEDRLPAVESGPRGKVVAAIAALDALIGTYGRAAAAAGAKARVFLPDDAGRPLPWQIDAWDDTSMTLRVSRKGERKSLGLWAVPPHLLGESAHELGVLDDPKLRAAIGLLVALHVRTRGAADRKAIEARVRRTGLLAGESLADAAGELLAPLLALAETRRAMREASARDVTSLLEKLVSALHALPKGSERDCVLAARVEPLLAEAFERSGEAGEPAAFVRRWRARFE